MTLVEAATVYAEQGWFVFPCKPGAKEPATPHGVKDAKNDAAHVARWWQRHPAHNVGLACGPSGLVVIDIDGAEGAATWEALCREEGLRVATVTARTPGGGRHLIFQAPEGVTIRNSVRALGPGLDVRSDGGYIVAPPSVHPNGGLYAWEEGAAPGEIALADLPPALIRLLTGEGRKGRAPLGLGRDRPPRPGSLPVREAGVRPLQTNEYLKRGRHRERRYAFMALHREAAALRETPEGARNDRLNRAAFRMGRLMARGALSDWEIMEALRCAALDAGLGQAETEATLKSGLRAGQAYGERFGHARQVVLREYEAKIFGGEGGRDPSGSPKPDGSDAPKPDGSDAPKPDGPKVALPSIRFLDGPEVAAAVAAAAVADGDVAELPNPLTYPLSDTGNGELLAALYGDRLRYVCDKGPWLVWDGTRWRHERKGEATLAAIEVARARQLAAVAEPDPKRARQIEQFGLRSESGRALRETLTCASHIAPIPLERQELDADPWLLGCHNGTLDLRTGQLRAGRQADLITRSCGAAYDPEARAPRWTRFLREITGGDEELLRYLALAAGYSLTADTREQVFFICLGHGANGKSTFLNALRAVAGDYGGHAAGSCFELREFGEGIPTDLAMLNGLRFVTAGETSQGRRLHEQRVKEVTGGDPITARKLYMDHSTFIPGLKLWMATNYRPEIRGTDAGIWRRVRVIPFRANFEDRAERDLGRALLDELPGILAWAVRGCLAWQEEGLPTPAAVADATGEYRDETDPLGRFLSMCVRPCPGGRVGASTLYDRYLRWCREDAQTAPLTRTKFGMEMVSRGLRRERAGGLKFYLDVMIDEDAA